MVCVSFRVCFLITGALDKGVSYKGFHVTGALNKGMCLIGGLFSRYRYIR